MFLDLSFNNIEKIEGLESLTKLADLSLYNNRISKLENLETLENLEVFSIGNNVLDHFDNVCFFFLPILIAFYFFIFFKNRFYIYVDSNH